LFLRPLWWALFGITSQNKPLLPFWNGWTIHLQFMNCLYTLIKWKFW
jgi:hypothetical protein